MPDLERRLAIGAQVINLPQIAALQQMNRLKTASFGRGSEEAARALVARIVAGGEEIKLLYTGLRLPPGQQRATVRRIRKYSA